MASLVVASLSGNVAMGDNDITRVAQVFLALISVALIAELVSKQAQTGTVLGKLGTALETMLCTATSPITGAGCVPVVNSVFKPI